MNGLMASLKQAAERQKQAEERLQKEALRANQAEKDRAVIETDYRHLQQRLNDQKSELEEMQTHFRAEFKNLANDILEEKSRRFTQQNSRSEEHTSELQSRGHLVCRLLLEKKNTNQRQRRT